MLLLGYPLCMCHWQLVLCLLFSTCPQFIVTNCYERTGCFSVHFFLSADIFFFMKSILHTNTFEGKKRRKNSLAGEAWLCMIYAQGLEVNQKNSLLLLPTICLACSICFACSVRKLPVLCFLWICLLIDRVALTNTIILFQKPWATHTIYGALCLGSFRLLRRDLGVSKLETCQNALSEWLFFHLVDVYSLWPDVQSETLPASCMPRGENCKESSCAYLAAIFAKFTQMILPIEPGTAMQVFVMGIQQYLALANYMLSMHSSSKDCWFLIL